MNGRLGVYPDKQSEIGNPIVGRFLSADNYVQMPDFSQGYNRYSYCLNNPLLYVDYSGNTWWNKFKKWATKHNLRDLIAPHSPFIWIASGIEAINNGDWSYLDPTNPGTKINNSSRLFQGLFAADTDKEGWGWQIVSRFFWQRPQTIAGLAYSNISNIISDGSRVRFVHGATVLNVRGNLWFTRAITFGSYITGEDIINNDWLLEHEYGHYLQSQSSGPLYLLKYGIPSAINNDGWYEDDAYARGGAFFRGIYNKRNFRNSNLKWWEFYPGIRFYLPLYSLTIKK